MPNPTSGDVHVNRPLTNISIAYMQDPKGFVADQIFPNIPVLKQSDRYWRYDRGDFNRNQMRMLQDRQVKAVKHLDRVVEELFDIVPKNTYITITADHGELFGEGGYFGHGPIFHKKVFEVPFVEGKIR